MIKGFSWVKSGFFPKKKPLSPSKKKRLLFFPKLKPLFFLPPLKRLLFFPKLKPLFFLPPLKRLLFFPKPKPKRLLLLGAPKEFIFPFFHGKDTRHYRIYSLHDMPLLNLFNFKTNGPKTLMVEILLIVERPYYKTKSDKERNYMILKSQSFPTYDAFRETFIPILSNELSKYDVEGFQNIRIGEKKKR